MKKQGFAKLIVTLGVVLTTNQGISQEWFAAPPSPVGVPSLVQLDGFQGNVPMKHKMVNLINGNEIMNHVLKNHHGNRKIKFKAKFSCPVGRKVNFLSVKTNGISQKILVNSTTNHQQITKIFKLTAFTLIQLKQAGQNAFGGSWVSPNTHNNSKKKVSKWIKKRVRIYARCTGWTNKVQRTMRTSTKFYFIDTNF